MRHFAPGRSRLGCAVGLFVLAGATGPWAAGPAPERPQQALADGAAATSPPAAPALSDADIEQFLSKGKILKEKGTKKGITGSTQATLTNGALTHDAHIQTIDESKREFRSDRGVEFDFRDSWSFNVAAYKLDRLLGLNMVPVSVPGHYRSRRAAITWWIDDVIMDEGDRLKKKITPADRTAWNRQMQMMRLFDELIANTDRNLGNMVYAKDWRLWLIDHTRAFRKTTSLKHSSYIARCDAEVFSRLKQLDRETLKRELGQYLDDGQIKGILARRDHIVKKLESLGPAAFFSRDAAPGS